MSRAERLATSGALLVLLVVPGCFAPSPTLEVSRATLSHVDSPTHLVTIDLDASNSGKKPLPLERVDYSLAINGSTALRATRAPNATLPAFGGRVITLPAPVERAPDETDEVSLFARIAYRQPGWFAKLLYDLRLYRPATSIRVRIEASPGEPEVDAARNQSRPTPTDTSTPSP